LKTLPERPPEEGRLPRRPEPAKERGHTEALEARVAALEARGDALIVSSCSAIPALEKRKFLWGPPMQRIRAGVHAEREHALAHNLGP